MKKLFPVLLALLGTGAGVGAGLLLKPGAEAMAETGSCGSENDKPATGDDMQTSQCADENAGAKGDDRNAIAGKAGDQSDASQDYIELDNQFVVPVVSEDMVDALVVLSLGVAVTPAQSEQVYRLEPKLRDAFLQVLFDHANRGGFRGKFTDGPTMDSLRMALTEAAQAVMGPAISGVVITGIARQDV